MGHCRICHSSPVKAAGAVCDSCRENIYARSRGDKVDEDHPAVQEFDSEMEKFGYSSSSSQASKQSGCAILAFAVAAVPVILMAMGMIRLVA